MPGQYKRRAFRKSFTDRVDVKIAVQEYFVLLMQKLKQGDADPGAMPWEERGQKGLEPFDLQQGQHGPATCRDEQAMLLQMDNVGISQGLLSPWHNKPFCHGQGCRTTWCAK